MRTLLLLPLALTAAAAGGGCRAASDETRQTAYQVPARDLTLRDAELPEAAVASPVELMRAPVQRATVHRAQRARRPAPASRGEISRPEGVSRVSAPMQLAPVSVASTAESEAPDPHALAPGQTVTIIPVSSSPAPTPEGTYEQPPDEGEGTAIHAGGWGHGGRCNPRGGGRPGGGGGFRGLR